MENGGGISLLARWVSNFDCGYETAFWACILDKPFQVQELKAKRRYEITKGKRNFYCRVLTGADLDAMHSVYVESLKGYKGNLTAVSLENFREAWGKGMLDKSAVFLGAFDRENDLLCGWAHCLQHGRYIPISSLKTRVSKEREGVNFALVNGICEYYEEELSKGCYLCDGYRNLVHETAFQDWLEKYFQFRKAYCVLNIKYRGIVGIAVKLLYPIRGMVGKASIGKRISSILLLEEWRRECESEKRKH